MRFDWSAVARSSMQVEKAKVQSVDNRNTRKRFIIFVLRYMICYIYSLAIHFIRFVPSLLNCVHRDFCI